MSKSTSATFLSRIAIAAGLFIAAAAQAQPPEAVEQSPEATAIPPEAAVDAELAAPVAEPLDSIAVAPQAEAEAAVETPKKASRLIEEVIVTAQKREERLQDVPISINAFSAETLDARGINDAAGLKLVTPAMVYDQLVGYSLIYIRGVGTEVFLPNQEPSVATYLDGIYYPFAHGLAQEFTPIERVEVLKGPQGTLFGRNATGGAISVTSVKPQNEWGGSAALTLGDFNSRKGKVYVTGPIVDGLSFSVGGLLSDEEPYYTVTENNPRRSLADNHSEGINARLMWEPTDRITALGSYYKTGFDGTFSVITSQIKPTPLGLAVGSMKTGPRETAFNEPGTIDAKTEVAYGQIEFRPDIFDIKLLGAHQDIVTDTRWDYDNGPLPAVFFYPVNQFSKNTSAELQLLSNETTPWAEHFEWIAGLYYFKSEGGFDPNSVGALNYADPGLPELFKPLGTLIAATGFPLSEQAPAVLNIIGTLRTEALAGFAQGTLNATDWLRVTVGARYQKEDRELIKSQVGLATDGYRTDNQITLLDFVQLFGRQPISNNDISPRIALDFKFIPDTLIYASFTQGFKSGTINIQNIYTVPTKIDPEKTTTYEIGVKGDLFDGALRYAVAAFDNTIDDLQTQVVSAASGGLISLVNAGQAEIYGGEFDITWQTFPELLPGLVVTASGAYLHGEYTDFKKGPGFDETTGVAFGDKAVLPARDFTGNKTVRTPKFSGDFGLSYSFNAPGGNVEIGSDIYYNDGYFFDTQNVTPQPSYYVLNARASYLYEPWDLRISLFGKNLTDQLYYTNIFANDFGNAATGAAPHTYGLTLAWKF